MELAESFAEIAPQSDLGDSRTRSSVRFLDFSVKVVRHRKWESWVWKAVENGIAARVIPDEINCSQTPPGGLALRLISGEKTMQVVDFHPPQFSQQGKRQGGQAFFIPLLHLRRQSSGFNADSNVSVYSKPMTFVRSTPWRS